MNRILKAQLTSDVEDLLCTFARVMNVIMLDVAFSYVYYGRMTDCSIATCAAKSVVLA
jgi:hypothetical protein